MRALIIALILVPLLGGCAAVEDFLDGCSRAPDQASPLEGNTTGGLK